MTKILHVADLHLNSPFSSVPPEKIPALRDDQFKIVDYICELCIREKIDIVLFAGDIFDSENTSFDSVLYLKNALAAIPSEVFISPGNHDWYSDKSHYASVDWSDNVHIFKSPVMEKVDVCGVSVYGAGFNSKWLEQGILSGFHADNPLSVGVIHGDFNMPSSRYNPVASSQIENSGLLYLALGHVHARTEIAKSGNTYYAYSGCAMGRGFDECGQKGAYILEIDDNCRLTPRFVPLPSKQYCELTVSLDGCRDFSEIIEKIYTMLPPDSATCILKITLTGSPVCEINSELLNGALAERCFYVVLRLKLSNTSHDIWKLCGDDSVPGLCMKKLFALYSSSANQSERESALIAAQYVYAAVKNISADEFGGVRL